MAENSESFWRLVSGRAWRETKELLFERTDRTMIAILLFFVYAAIIWVLGGRTSATGEILLKLAATAAPILILPFVWVWRFSRVASHLYDDKCTEVSRLKRELEGREKIELALIQDRDETYFRITNLGPQATVNARIDYNQAGIGEAFRVHVEPYWLDGYASSQRVLSEGEHNIFFIRKIIENEGTSTEQFYGSVGMENKMWKGRSWSEVSTPSSELPKSRITVIISAEPRFPGGPRKIVFDTVGHKLILISGEVEMVQ